MTDINQYNNKVNTTLDNIEYVIKNGGEVYGGDELKRKYEITKHNESAAVNEYKNLKHLAFNEKLLNWQLLQEARNKVSNMGNDIANMSDSSYTNEFNENIIKLNQLDQEISTKDKIILMNQYTYENKEMITKAMRSALLYLVLMILPFTLILMGNLTPLFGYGFIIVCGIITGIVIIVNFKRDGQESIVNLLEKNSKTAKDLAKNFLKDVFPKSFIKPCPRKCSQEEEEETPPLPPFDYNHGNEVWLDNSQDRWKNGDIPEIGATVKGWNKIKKGGQPKPFYGPDPQTPTYQCRWKYDPAKMTNMDKGLTFHTRIPCEFYPGYETVSKI